MRLYAENLECRRGGRDVFTGLGFSVSAGAFLELRGTNGSGKTSLLRMIAELNEPAVGTLHLDGAHEKLTRGQHCHFIGHQDALKPVLSVRENLEFWAGFFGGGDVDAALQAFALDGLADYPAAFLSAGQKRRLALSRLILCGRAVWLLDEPSVGLDAASCETLCATMREQLERGGIIVATTHIDLGVQPDQVLNVDQFEVAL